MNRLKTIKRQMYGRAGFVLTAGAGAQRRLKERGGDDTAGTRTAAVTESAGEPT